MHHDTSRRAEIKLGFTEAHLRMLERKAEYSFIFSMLTPKDETSNRRQIDHRLTNLYLHHCGIAVLYKPI
jgi:hypothetical protein